MVCRVSSRSAHSRPELGAPIAPSTYYDHIKSGACAAASCADGEPGDTSAASTPPTTVFTVPARG